MNRTQVHVRHVLLVWIEDHMPCHSVVLRNVGERIMNARAIQSRLADGTEQRIHRVVCE